jgi:hypothetical protein
MINDLLKYHSYGAVISKNGGVLWLVDYTQNQLNRIFKNVKYSSFWIDPVNNNIYIYL